MGYDVVITPSYARAQAWRKRRAREDGSGLFGCTVATFDAWIADLWELHGDGRLIVDGMQREVVARSVLVNGLDDEMAAGLAPLAVACARDAVGVAAFDRAMAEVRAGGDVAGLSGPERDFLAAFAGYEDALAELGLVEYGRACALLVAKERDVFTRQLHVLVDSAVPLSWIQEAFFGACSQLSIDVPEVDGGVIRRAPDGVDVRFAFPSGRLAEPGVVADVVRACSGDGDVLVACKDPLWLAQQVEAQLVEAGRAVCVQASKPFARTDFGRVFLAGYHCVHDEPWDAAYVTDILLSPFSGVGAWEAREADRVMRGDRLVARDAAVRAASALSDPFSQVIELASDPEADILIGAFEHMVQGMAHRSPSWRAEQLAAMSTLRAVTSAARRAHVGIRVCAEVLQRASVAVSYRADADAGPDAGASGGRSGEVVISGQGTLAECEPGCCGTLVVADLTSEDYPVADRDDAASTLFSTLGLPPEEGALARARREFNALLELPTQAVYLVRPLGDANAAETYPCVTLEEFVDAYRADASATEDVDNAYRLPACLQDGLRERGEELLFANAEAAEAGVRQDMEAQGAWPRIDELDVRYASRVAPRRCRANGELTRRACPSPSQVETYLECPYRWFATRRLRMEELDEGFGPREFGDFAHAALMTFYERFQERGWRKVEAGNLDEARAVMREVVDALVRLQPQVEPGNSRVVAVTELEQRELVAFCGQLVDYLDFEARLLPTFYPAHFEYEIGLDDGIDYAGRPLVGRVDRIDVDGKGNAVVIDYKGTIRGYELADACAALPGKVQARMYARAVERALGVRVVGALYVSYGRRPGVAGTFDARVIEAAHLPNMNHDRCACRPAADVPDPLTDEFPFAQLAFEDMLDETERVVGAAIDEMERGVVECAPAFDGACAYCPVLACEKRRS